MHFVFVEFIIIKLNEINYFQTLAHEPQVLKQGLLHLNEALQCLEPLHKPLDPPGGSVLLEELISAPNINDATLSAQSTPLLHNMAAAHAYIITLVHMCRTGQVTIYYKSISIYFSKKIIVTTFKNFLFLINLFVLLFRVIFVQFQSAIGDQN